MSGIYPKSDYWDAQTPEFRAEVLGHVITMEREYAGRLRAERDAERANMQSLAKWAGVPESTPSLEIAAEVSTRIEALEAAVDTWTEMAARRHRALGEVEASYREAIARAERAEQKSAELAAVLSQAKRVLHRAESQKTWREDGWEVPSIDVQTAIDILSAVPADVLSAYTTRIREEALACEEVEYTFSEVLDDGTVAYSSPFATLEEAAEAQAKARMNYPWPEEIGLARRRAPGPWAVIPEGEDR